MAPDQSSMDRIPKLYFDRMQVLLGDEFPAFQNIYHEQPAAGLRVNTPKLSVDDFTTGCLFPLQPLAWSSSGFFILPGKLALQPGKHPYHAAGLYYLQDPSAMAAVEILAPEPGERVLDLSAAPGGKSTQIVARMQNRGLFVANETHPRRAWDLAENLERWGARNAVITNESAQNLADHFGAFFDRVLVDAPCSGEGMFRKSEPARSDWSVPLVHACAQRQSNILQQAARLVKPGGLLVYTTCTFNPEENEEVISRFITSKKTQGGPVFEMVHISGVPQFASARPDWVSIFDKDLDQPKLPELEKAIRLWPHHGSPEGHFIACMQRLDRGNPASLPVRRSSLPRQVREDFKVFCQQNIDFEPGELRLEGSYLYQVPEEMPSLGKLRVIHPGWWLGESRANRFVPSHALALALQVSQFRRQVVWDAESSEMNNYLKGEVIDNPGEEGWVAVCIQYNLGKQAFPIGWGKRSSEKIKNYYPRGLRRV